VPRKPAASAASSAASYGISQTELGTYRAIHSDVRRLSADLEARRQSLVSRLEAGATVEPGILAPQLSSREVRRLTAGEIGRILGPELLAEIRTQLQPALERLFAVIELPGEATP
jgi:hypothetical protein